MVFRYPLPSGYRKPGQPYSRFGYDGQLWLPGRFGKNYALQSGGVLGFLRSIATRASVPDNFFANATPTTNLTSHITRDSVDGLYVGWFNTSLVPNSGEFSAGTQTCQGLVEHPAGVFTPIKWGGSTSVVAAPGTMPLGFAAVKIPNNTSINIRSQLQGSINILYSDAKQKMSTDAQQTGGTDMLNVVNNGVAITFPSLVAGFTNKRAPLMIGDSRIAGFNHQATVGNQGNTGDFQTAFSPTYAGTRYGGIGLTAAAFAANHAAALILAQYHTDIVYNLGINDIVINGTSAPALQTLTASNVALFTALAKKVYLSTLQTVSASSNSWIDQAGQTINVNSAVRVSQNTVIRANGIAGQSGFFEFANIVEQIINNSFWKFDGSAFKYTQDGVHLNNFSTPLIGSLLLP